MAARKSRNLKVYEQSGYHYKPTPTIHLQGQWLKDIGFEIGKFIQVNCEEGKLVITLDEARGEVEAENESKGTYVRCHEGWRREIGIQF